MSGSEQLLHQNQAQIDLMGMLHEVVEHSLDRGGFVSLSAQGLVNHIEKDPTLYDMGLEAQATRMHAGNPLTTAHLMGLMLMHIPNYSIIWKENNWGYPNDPALHLNTADGWEALHARLQADHYGLYQHLLATKDVQTTTIGRGIAMPTIIQRIFGDAPINVVDFGCSANLVWAELVAGQNGDYQAVDNTPGQMVMRYAQNRLNITSEIGIDHTDPLQDEESEQWFLACGHPNEVTREAILKKQQTIQRLRNTKGVEFRKGDIKNPCIAPHTLKAITASTMLYQVPEVDRREFIDYTIPRLLMEDGPTVAIVQDYCIKDKNGEIQFIDGRGSDTYRTMVRIFNQGVPMWMEVLRMETSMCNKIEPGANFEEFVTITQKE